MVNQTPLETTPTKVNAPEPPSEDNPAENSPLILFKTNIIIPYMKGAVPSSTPRLYAKVFIVKKRVVRKSDLA
jgi:hypothetical protein